MLTTIRVANIPTGATTTIVARIQRLTKETICSRCSNTVSGQRCPWGCDLACRLPDSPGLRNVQAQGCCSWRRGPSLWAGRFTVSVTAPASSLAAPHAPAWPARCRRERRRRRAALLGTNLRSAEVRGPSSTTRPLRTSSTSAPVDNADERFARFCGSRVGAGGLGRPSNRGRASGL
jgi:hypothetical protein